MAMALFFAMMLFGMLAFFPACALIAYAQGCICMAIVFGAASAITIVLLCIAFLDDSEGVML